MTQAENIKQFFDGEIKSDVLELRAGAGSGEIEGWASYKSVDRYGDLVLPSSFLATIPKFLKNALLCLGHDSSGYGEDGLPLGSVKEMSILDEGVKFRATFANTPLAQMVRSLYVDGHMKAFSIGFWVRGQRDPTEEESVEYGPKLRRVITDLELAEISCVPLPACREALALSVRGMSVTASKEGRMELKSFMQAVLKQMEAVDVPAPAKKSLEAELKASVVLALEAYKQSSESFMAVGDVAKQVEACEDAEGLKALAASFSERSTACTVKAQALENAVTALRSMAEKGSTVKTAGGNVEDFGAMLKALRETQPAK